MAAKRSKKQVFLIIDGHAVLHRAWHALPPLTTKDGRIVSGAYGFTSTLLKAIKEFDPEYVAVTFDPEGGTFRHEEYEEYKATREEQPDELYAQIPIIEEILEEMRIPAYVKEGFEADDVIGTITKLAPAIDKDIECIIVTGDMDTLQLVDARTKVFTMRKGFTDTVLYDTKAVQHRYGFKPALLIDYKALRGDPSDNIKGVAGIGEKTATELVTAFGTVEEIYAALAKGGKKVDALKPAVRKKLEEQRKEAELSKRLVTIRRDVPLEFDLHECEYVTVTREQMRRLFEELQFTRMLQQLPTEKEAYEPEHGGSTMPLFDVAPATARAPIHDVHETPWDVEKDLAALKSAKHVAFRSVLRTDDPEHADIVALVFSGSEKAVVVAGDMIERAQDTVKEFINGLPGVFIVHDLKRELNVLRRIDARPSQPFDLMIASYLLYSGDRRHSLDAMLSFYRSMPPAPATDDDAQRIARVRAETEQFIGIWSELSEGLNFHKLRKLYDEVELPLAAVLARMERNGIAIDVAHFGGLSKDLAKRIDVLTERIYGAAGEEFNINSPAQLRSILFEKLEISVKGLKKTEKSGTLSTAASELSKLRETHPIIDMILEYRELTKLRATYVDAIPPLAHARTGRIHASFNQTVAATGRLSSSDPNMQNIPTTETEEGRAVRNGFIARKGYVLLAADYSQIELRIAAHIAGEKKMIDAFKKGEDIHWRTAVEMFGESEAASHRRIAKVINFGILYGMGANSLAEAAGITFMEARDYIERYFTQYPAIGKYMEDTVERVKTRGFVETLFGRKRFFPNYDVMNRREQAEAERQAINMPIQGTNADLIKIAMREIDRHIMETYGEGDDAAVRMLLQVHDELVFEIKEKEIPAFTKVLVPLMTGTVKLAVPVVVNISKGARWGDLKRVEE